MSDIDTVLVDSLKALDPKRPIREADVVSNAANGSFVPKAAVSNRSKRCYSITSSAVASSVGGTVRPSDLAV